MDELKKIWNNFKQMPELGIAIIIVIIAILVYVAQRNNSSTTTQPQNQTTPLLFDFGTPAGTPGTGSGTGTTGTGGGTGPLTATIRSKTPVDSASGKETSVPLFSDVNTNTSSGHIPFGTQVTVTGPAVSGRTAKSANGKFTSSTWYPITWNGQNGFVISYDLSNPPSQSSSSSSSTDTSTTGE